MNVEDIIRDGLHELADGVTPIADLHLTAAQRGRRRRTARRLAATSGAALSVAAIVGAGVVIAGNTGGNTATVKVPSANSPAAVPWWQTWTTDRSNGGIDKAFLVASRPTYDTSTGPETISVYAAGTTPDGTQWVMFTDPHDGHVMQWLQGWDDQPDVGESTQTVTPDITWTSWSTPTLAAHDSTTSVQQWLIVVGQPGTTSIEYSPDGTTWQPMDVQQGIGVMKIANGFPPATAMVRLSNAAGVYAEGTPAGAGAGTETPGGDAGTAEPTPTATPTPTSTGLPSTAPTAASSRLPVTAS